MTKNTHAADLVDDGNNVTIGKKRHAIAIDSACEIEQLCRVILAEVSRKNCTEDLAVRGIAMRLHELSSIVMSAIGDELEKTADLANRLSFELEGVE